MASENSCSRTITSNGDCALIVRPNAVARNPVLSKVYVMRCELNCVGS